MKELCLRLVQETLDEVYPGGISSRLVEVRADAVDVESGCAIDVAISAHLHSKVRNVEDFVASHLLVEGGVANALSGNVRGQESVKIGLRL